MGTRMKTTVDIADDLAEAARERARREGITLRALLEEGLRLALARREPSGDLDLELLTYGGDGFEDGVDLNDPAQLREAVYAERSA